MRNIWEVVFKRFNPNPVWWLDNCESMLQVALMREAVTIGTLAEELGVAKSTVSRALRGDPRISKATKERVVEHAARMGFEPHPYVQVLMTQRRMQRQMAAQANLVYLNDYASMEDFVYRPIAKRIFEAARERARDKGWNLDLEFLNPDDVDGSKMARRLRRRGVLGVILGRTLAPKDGIPSALLHFSLVADSRYWRQEGLDRVNMNGLEIICRLLTRIFKMGAKKIAVFVPAHLICPGGGSIYDAIHLLGLSGSGVVVLDPLICSAKALTQALVNNGVDGLLFHHREHRPWLVEMLTAGEVKGVIAEYCPPNDDPLPWMNVTIPAKQIGSSLADLIIEKVCRSDTGLSDLERVIGFPGVIRDASAG